MGTKDISKKIKIKTNLKKIRMGLGMERKDFADMIEVVHNTYYGWERGVAVPSLAEAIRVCEALKLPVTDVWFEDKDI